MGSFAPEPNPWTLAIVIATVIGVLQFLWEAFLARAWWKKRKRR